MYVVRLDHDELVAAFGKVSVLCMCGGYLSWHLWAGISSVFTFSRQLSFAWLVFAGIDNAGNSLKNCVHVGVSNVALTKGYLYALKVKQLVFCFVYQFRFAAAVYCCFCFCFSIPTVTPAVC